MVPLRKKVRRLLVVFGIASFTFVALIAATIEYQIQRESLAQAMNKHSKVLRTLLEKNIEAESVFMERFAASWKDGDRGAFDVFEQSIQLRGQDNLLYILDANSRIEGITEEYKNFIGLDFSHLPYIRNHEAISSVHQSIISRKSVVSLTKTLPDNRLLVLEKNTGDLLPQIELFGQQELIPNGQLFVLSNAGTVVYHPDMELVRARHNLGMELTVRSSEDWNRLRVYELRGENFLVYEEELKKPAGWKVYYAVPFTALIDRAMFQMSMQFGILFIVFTSLLSALVLLLNRYFSTPIADMVLSLDAYPDSGDKRVIPESRSRGTLELARIIEAVNSMAAKLRRSQDQLKTRERLFRTVTEFAVEWVFWLDPEGGIRYISPSCEKVTGFRQDEFYEDPSLLHSLIHPDDHALWDDHRHEVSGEGEAVPLDFRIRTKSGRIRWIRHFCGPVASPNGSYLGKRGSNIDITEQKQAEQELYYNAFYDRITGLANRNLFLDRLERSLARRTRESYDFAVLFLDLDRFKVVNDSLGHMLGDQLLVAVAKRLNEECRPADTVARLGGDEFAVLLEGVSNPTTLQQFSQRIHERFGQPFQLDGHEVYSGASIGVSLSDDSYTEPKEMLRDADTAMYYAKSSGRGRTETFTSQMHVRAVERLSLETDLRRAVERTEIVAYYQPIVSLDSGAVAGLEVLARWEHPRRGLLPPSDFISLAEETGTIIRLGENIVEAACTQLQAWQKDISCKPPLFVNVNVSGLQLTQPQLPEYFAQVLAEYDLAPGSLRLELTESVLLEHSATVYDVLQKITARGIPLYLDDFGTGYSSLSCLCRFPFSAVKIDKEFVASMTHSQRDRNIVRAILDMAQGLNLQTVAEGIETEEQLALVREFGCTFGQGYLFAKPMDAESMGAHIGL